MSRSQNAIISSLGMTMLLAYICPTLAQDDCPIDVLIAEDPAESDYFGSGILVHGDYLFVGVPRDDDAGTNAGAVHVYRSDPTGWLFETKLIPSDAEPDDFFSSAFAADGDYLVARSWRDDVVGSDSGSAYIFQLQAGVWVEAQKLIPSDPADSDYFGSDVSISGDYLVIGASDDDDNGENSGSAYVFNKTLEGWVEQAKLLASDGASGDRFGGQVAINGDIILVGADDADILGEDDGAVYVFVRQAEDWTQQTKLTAGTAVEHFGASISFDGDDAVIGVNRYGTGAMAGACVFAYDGASWTNEAFLAPGDPTTLRLDLSQVLKEDDTIIFSGWEIGGSTSYTVAYLFRHVGGSWLQRAKLEPPIVSPGPSGLAVAGNSLLIGAYRDNTAATEAGAVYIIEAFGDDPDCNADTISDPCQLDCNGNGVPESCEPYLDCDDSGLQDTCDIYYGLRDDCNGNWVPDWCDIDSGASRDCNDDGVPDECQVDGDCNGNGIDDLCDLGSGFSLDCNLNLIPDECDRDSPTSDDCNADAILDECQLLPDCNQNGVPDECDVASGASADCNNDVVPDECQPQADCNENAVLDLCEIGDGLLPDENGNWIADECECSSGAVFMLTPVGASGDHTINTFHNEITLTHADQRVWLELYGCGWNSVEPIPMRSWYARLNAAGYGSGTQGSAMPWSPPCDSDSDCEVLLGQGSTCGYDYFVPEGGCYPAFMGCPRPDSLCLDLPAANLGTLDYWYHSMPPLPTYVPGGETPAYAGTLVLEMSPDALGTFTIPLHDFPDTRINVLYGTLPIASVMPARIRVGAGCCLPDGSCITDDGSCRDEGGTPAHYPCQGDCDGNGVDDACEAADDCNNNNVVDTCDISGGTSEDTNSNWIPDECEEGACCLCATGPGCTHTSLLECNNMGGYFAAAGQYCAEVSCPTGMPPNDDAAGAITVTEGIFDFDNRCATTDGLWIEGEMCIWDPDVPLEKDVWFEYVPACDGWLYVGVTGAESDPLVAVYCNDYLGTCDSLPSPSREFACSQDGVVQLPVEADKCYLIRVGGDPGTAGTILVDMLCSVVDCMWYAAPEAEPGGADKNRYLSFSGGYPGRPQALRVTLVDMPPPFDYLDGDIMWVGPPNQLTEASGSSDDTPPAFWSAKLDCEPHLMDWSELGVIHVTGEAVVPGATYRIDALDAYCVPSTCYEHGCWPGCFWDPLIVHTGSWGDAVGDCAVTPCTGPDGLVDFVDIMAVVDKFRNLPTAPIKARADLCPDEPDGIIDFVDISWIVGAFRGHAYPYDGPAGCQ